ncbi:hypothetical protein QBC43DRAFT_349186 [Cladorrhinum sp. PSN259]|nr:hypothetical protein QBC43DRAFT_349186 [Cladorrhinum sp. PSN259]
MAFTLYLLLSSLALTTSVISSPPVGQVTHVKRDDTSEPQTCTELSGEMSWTAKAFHLRSTIQLSSPTEVASGTGWLSFSLSNPAVPYELSCQGTSSDLTDFFHANHEFPCDNAPDGISKATFRFDKPSGSFEVNQLWYCNDDMGSRWSASGSTNVTLNCVTNIAKAADWKEGSGQVYATNTIDCGTLDISVSPSEMDAVA